MLLGLPSLAGGVACVVRTMGPGTAAERAGFVLRLAVLFHVGFQLGVTLHQSRVDYSTTYDYGQQGMAETASFIRARTHTGERISSMKDVGVLAGRRYFESYAAVYGSEEDVRRLIKQWESGKVRFIIWTEGIGQDQLVFRPSLRQWVAGNARLVASFGNYRIYEPIHHRSAERR